MPPWFNLLLSAASVFSVVGYSSSFPGFKKTLVISGAMSHIHAMRLITVSVLMLSLSLSQCVVFEALGSVSSSVDSASDLLESVSDSLKSISSSLESSSGDDEKASGIYHREVRSLTVLAVKEKMDSPTFLREVGRIARSHGIVDWAGTPVTVQAIGEGLKEAGVSSGDYAAIRQSLVSGGKSRTVAALDSGYSGM